MLSVFVFPVIKIINLICVDNLRNNINSQYASSLCLPFKMSLAPVASVNSIKNVDLQYSSVLKHSSCRLIY